MQEGVPRGGKRCEDRPRATSPVARQLEAGDVLTVTRLDRRPRAGEGARREDGPQAETPHQKQEILRRKENGEAVREIARSYNVHNSTISRLAAAL
jgi:DNA invertase Pin-like site-specific DNA recombinase